MEYVAQSNKREFLFKLTKDEILTIVFGNRNANYRDSTKSEAIELLRNLRKGKVDNLDISKMYTKSVSIINTNTYEDIKEDLTRLLNQIKHIEEFQENLTKQKEDE